MFLFAIEPLEVEGGLHWSGQHLGVEVLIYALAFTLLSFAFLYVVLRLRSAGSEPRDPHLGFKAVLHYLLSLSVFLLLSGLTMVVVDLMNAAERKASEGKNGAADRAEQPLFSATQRNGVALALSGAVFAALYWSLLRAATNDNRWPLVRRLFAGWRFAIHALVILFVSTWLMMILFREDVEKRGARLRLERPQIKELQREHQEERNLPVGFLLVWGPSWFFHLGLLWWYANLSEVPQDQVSRL
jgi:hypothetical protein